MFDYSTAFIKRYSVQYIRGGVLVSKCTEIEKAFKSSSVSKCASSVPQCTQCTQVCLSLWYRCLQVPSPEECVCVCVCVCV